MDFLAFELLDRACFAWAMNILVWLIVLPTQWFVMGNLATAGIIGCVYLLVVLAGMINSDSCVLIR